MATTNVDLNLKWEDQNVVEKDGMWTVDGVALSYHHQPPNIPGTSWLGLLITAPPNSATPPHTHGGAAASATVIRGRVLNQMVHTHTDPVTGETRTHDSGARIYGPGESWYEAPGCHHVRSENVGDEEALFVANLIVSNKVFEGLDLSAKGQEADFAKIARVVIIDKDVEGK
ncbi:uncharacterized protein DNG_09937 [Cephalotrichum gorgonifer]|uniref:Cupin type-1 domain-containing protein n=1 Tax=Cephalotrichum gorgonifer TaxID=2041049 RepID=A0AAE8SZW1_9PEZI|nr:uncharacterized protein DNG_09937 [Cephalotrichum gorgonifer]